MLDSMRFAFYGVLAGIVSLFTMPFVDVICKKRNPDGMTLINPKDPANCHIGTFSCDEVSLHMVKLDFHELKRFRKWIRGTTFCSDYQEVGLAEVGATELTFVLMSEEAWPKFQSWWDRTRRQPNGDNITRENVRFLDEVSGHEDGRSMIKDELRSVTDENQAQLGDFLSRPILAASYVVNPGVTLDETITPWSLFFGDPYVARRLANFKLLSCTLKAKFVINGAPFHYGRFLVSYTPMSGYDDLTPDRATVSADFVGLSQRPHIFLDPTTCSGGTITMPFMYFKNKIDIIDPYDFLRMGSLRIKTLNTLKHSNGAVDPISISVYLWAEDVEMSVPTQHLPLNYPALPTRNNRRPDGGDEYAQGPVSRPASAVANAASALSQIGILAPYARATEIGARAVGKMASLFGFSRPVMIQTAHMKPNVKPSMATSNQDDDCNKLSLDVKQELTLDPRTFGMTDKDEMAFDHITGVESYLDTFQFTTSSATEELLWNCIVDPRLQKVIAGSSPEIHFTSLAFAAAPFQKWRGTIKYRFQIVCSKYHRGRIKVVYDPEGSSTLGTTAPYNTAYTTIVDLKDTTDFSITVGWGQSKTYRDIAPLLTPTSDMYGTLPLPYLSSLDEYGNGTLSVYCVTDLAVPNTTVNNDISINVFVSSNDIEFAVPTGEVVSRLRLTPTSVVASATEACPQRRKPDSAEVEEDTSHAQDRDSDNPTGAPVVNTFGPTLSITDKTNLVHFGESIRSFRQLIKRYSLHEILEFYRDIPGFDIANGNVNDLYATFQRHALPFEPGYTDTVTESGNTAYYPLLSGNYAYGVMTPLRYLTTAYVGWRGSIRYMIDHSSMLCACDKPTISTTRYSKCGIENEYVASPVQTGAQKQVSQLIFNNDTTYQEGGMLTATSVNPVTNFEVPYYSEYRFAPARKRVDFSNEGSTNWMPCWKHKIHSLFRYDATHYNETMFPRYRLGRTFVAAGEDFQVSGFIGAPPFYYEGTPPGV